jgi:lipopolysaccharide export system protein LptC
MTQPRWLKPVAWTVGVLVAIGFGIGVYQAGLDAPPPPTLQPTTIQHGQAEGRRLDGRSWSLDYDRIRMSTDQVTADLDGIRDGKLFRKGKPPVRLQAQHATINTASNDFTLTGPVTIKVPENGKLRTFTSDSAVWNSFSQTLVLAHPSTFTQGDIVLHVDHLSWNVKTGETKLGKIRGTM